MSDFQRFQLQYAIQILFGKKSSLWSFECQNTKGKMISFSTFSKSFSSFQRRNGCTKSRERSARRSESESPKARLTTVSFPRRRIQNSKGMKNKVTLCRALVEISMVIILKISVYLLVTLGAEAISKILSQDEHFRKRYTLQSLLSDASINRWDCIILSFIANNNGFYQYVGMSSTNINSLHSISSWYH